MASIDARPGIPGANGSGEGVSAFRVVPEANVSRTVAADPKDRLKLSGTTLASRLERAFNGGRSAVDILDRIS